MNQTYRRAESIILLENIGQKFHNIGFGNESLLSLLAKISRFGNDLLDKTTKHSQE